MLHPVQEASIITDSFCLSCNYINILILGNYNNCESLALNSDTQKASDLFVVLGEHNLDVVERTEMIVGVRSIIVHERYSDETSDNDIAVLRLEKDIRYNAYIKPVSLPSRDVADNTVCYATGWGETQGRYLWLPTRARYSMRRTVPAGKIRMSVTMATRLYRL